MRLAGKSAFVLLCSAAWLVCFVAVNPFERVSAVLDYCFGALPAWTQVENLYQDPATQEVSRGSHPLKSFALLSSVWANHPTARRIMLMGNSQTQAVSLARGEAAPNGPAKTYTDLIAAHFQRQSSPALFYRLSAGALSYEEMLWYSLYLSDHPEIKPDVLMVQLNYQNFANGQIRNGMLEMLSDSSFRANIEALSRENKPYAEDFRNAVDQYHTTQKTGASNAVTGLTPQEQGWGSAFDDTVRTRFDRIASPDTVFEAKSSFVLMLLRSRSYLLHLQQATGRSLSGPRVAASRAALERLLLVSERAHIHVVLFQAPTNPKVHLYQTSADEKGYHSFTRDLAACGSVTLLDFEQSVPAEHWGMALNGPDPLHLSRAGHDTLAGLLMQYLDN